MPEFGGKTYGYDVKGLKQLEKDKASARATRREQRARPGTITTTERKTIESGTLPTSEQQMPTRYPQFDAQANPTEMGAVAAQLSGSGQGQGIVPGINLEDIIKMLAGGAGGPVTRKPRP